jgi:parallel beta helix pectate lyase-like protein
MTRLAALLVLGRLLIPQAEVASSRPLGEPVVEPSTLHSIGVYWIIQGDGNRNARIDLEYRMEGSTEWRKGPPLFRVEKEAHKNRAGASALDLPPDARLFAGSIVGLQPDTGYTLRLLLADPNGGISLKPLSARTAREPSAAKDVPVIHVKPGPGGGSGTAADPYQGLKQAQDGAKPGDLILVHAGLYKGTFFVSKSGEPGRPIIWRGADDGEAVIDGDPKAERLSVNGIEANRIHDVWFERLTVRNCGKGLTAHNSARVVIRRCRFQSLDLGIVCTVNDESRVQGFFISDNVLQGPFSWSMPGKKGAGLPEYRGIQITGAGHDVCYNRISGFKDAIDTYPSPRCAAIDIHHNEISESLDDGIELDDSERNVRCFENRLTNAFQGISVQPVHGGPAYVFRNVLHNVLLEPFKMHSRPSGVLLYHNTVVRKGSPLVLLTPERVHHCVSRNNLFIGSAGNYAYENDAPMVDCDFDFDGFGGGPWKWFLKWNGQRFASVEETKVKAPQYRHAVLVDSGTVFPGGSQVPEDPEKGCPIGADLRLNPDTAAVDAGEILPGFNDGYAGKGPDLGAYEVGSPMPHYGPRAAK